MSAIEDQVKAYWDAQPSPHAPGLTNGEVPVAVKLATKAKYGGHASMAEASLFWHEFKGMGISPEDFDHTLDRLAPLSFAYHGRPPSMQEIKDLNAAHPKDVRSYYADLPDVDYPHVSAGQMVGAMQSAKPWAQQYLGRPPVKPEAAYLVHSKESPDAYYSRIAATDSTAQGDVGGAQTGTGANAGSGSSGAPR